jgi:serine/threonine-protein kinase
MPALDPWAQRLAALLSDRYEFVEFLGKGGFAAVYKVTRNTLNRPEALKILLEVRADDSEYADRFQQEARLAAALDHPNIIRIYDFGEVGGYFWYSMQFVDGPTLSRELKTKGPMDEASAARLSIPLLDALEYSHERGVIHRDIKPDNLILDGRRHPYVMDFGIAKAEGSLVKTKSGFVLGSPAYLSPEQLRGETLDGRSDVYSYGVTLYQMLSGARPFDSDDPSTMLMKRLKEDAPPLSLHRPGISAEMEGIVMRSLARDRASRYGTAGEMRDEMKAFLLAQIGDSSRAKGLVPHLETFVAVDTKPAALPAEDRAATRAMSETAPTAHLPKTSATVRHVESGPQSLSTPAAAPAPAEMPAAPPANVRAQKIAIGVGALAVIVAAAVFLRKPATTTNPPIVTSPTSAPAPRPTLAVAVPTAAPAPAPTAVAVAPTAAPAPPRATPVARVASAPLKVSIPRHVDEPPVAFRRPKTPPFVEEQVPVKLPSDIAGEYSGKHVGFNVVVGADGTLKSFRLVSKADPPCPQCDDAATEALKKFKFSAAKDVEGKPIEASFGLSVTL